jgi:hypothetical protein
VLGAQALQHAHLDADQVGVEHAHQDVGRAGRVGQRAEDVEDGAHAQLLAHRGDVLHRRVVVGREHEADAGGSRCSGDLLGVRLMLAPSASSTSALPDLTTRCARRAWPRARRRRRRRTSAGGDVEGVRAVAAGADDVDQVRAVGHLDLGANSRITCAAAVISPMVSFFTRRPVRRPSSWRHDHHRRDLAARVMMHGASAPASRRGRSRGAR